MPVKAKANKNTRKNSALDAPTQKHTEVQEKQSKTVYVAITIKAGAFLWSG